MNFFLIDDFLILIGKRNSKKLAPEIIIYIKETENE